MNALRMFSAALGAAVVAGSIGATQSPAKADTASTAAIVAGASAIVGALLYDGSNHPYYVRSNRRYYVTPQEATYYRGHHRGTTRNAFVPEQEYPVARDPYHGGNPGREDNNMSHGNNGSHGGNNGSHGNDPHGDHGH